MDANFPNLNLGDVDDDENMPVSVFDRCLESIVNDTDDESFDSNCFF